MGKLESLAIELARRRLVKRGVRSMFIDVAGERIHFLDLAGRWDGPPVVLLHGLGGSALDWSGCFFGLARRATRVVAVDLPGAGFSPVPKSGPLGIDESFSFFERFMAEEVRRPAVVVGNSLGGAMAVRFAVRHPESVAALVLVAPAGARGELDTVVERLGVRTLGQALELAGRVFDRPPLFRLITAYAMRERMSSPPVRRLLQDAAESAGLSAEELESLRPPTLLLWGRSERLLPYAGVGFFKAHLPPDAEVQEVKGFGHAPQLERPKELCKRINSFLERRGVVRLPR
ncbi:MAG: alpha/beta fold hydrolase [Myxococcales bacterium]|jgi:pimeloyl-ACP methyl ester carboxylesterase